jgi:hypothetical protein
MAHEDLKYGWIAGGKISVPVPMAATQALYAQSGRFVYMNAGAATLNADGIGSIFGFLEAHQHTPDTGAYLNCIIDLTAIFRIPIISGTYVVGMIGDQCDIAIDTVQGAQLDASAENTLTVVGGDLVNNYYVDVMMTPTEWGTGIGVEA